MGSGTAFAANEARFTDNQAFAVGGAIRCVIERSVDLTGVTFASSRAESGGGLASAGAHKSFIEECLFHDNEGVEGGGIYSSTVTGDTIIMVDCTFSSNLAGARTRATLYPLV